MEFRVSDQGIKKVRKRLILSFLFTFMIAGIAIFTGYLSAEPHGKSFAGAWDLLGMPVIVGLVISSIVLRSSVTTYSSYVLTVTADRIMCRQKKGQERSIPFAHVKEISRLKGGIIIVQGMHDRIVIPADMEQAAMLESVLNAIVSISEPATSGTTGLKERIGLGLFLVAMIYGYFGGDNLLANCCKVTPLAVAVFLAIRALVIKQTSRRSKRIARYFLIILALGALTQVIMYFTIMHKD